MKCNFCGEREGTEVIPDPNDFGSSKDWNVCKECKVFINKAHKLSFWEYTKQWSKDNAPEMIPFVENKLKEVKANLGFNKVGAKSE